MPVTARPLFTSRTVPRKSSDGTVARCARPRATSARDVDRRGRRGRQRSHPPATGGMIATSSPPRTTLVARRVRSFTATSGFGGSRSAPGMRANAAPARRATVAPARQLERRAVRAERVGVRGEEQDGDGHGECIVHGRMPQTTTARRKRAPSACRGASIGEKCLRLRHLLGIVLELLDVDVRRPSRAAPSTA